MELYIENTLIDLDEEVSIILVKQFSDIYDPSKIKNDFSRTISIPNTSNNNITFGNIWSVVRNVSGIPLINIGSNFNPSQKANFILYDNGNILMRGYVKLNEIVFENEKEFRYSITLFGEMGNFLSKFDDTKLFDFFKNTSNIWTNNRFQFTAASIYNLYKNESAKDRVRTSTNFYTNSYIDGSYTVPQTFASGLKNLYIDYIDAEDGLVNDNMNLVEFESNNDDATKKTTDLNHKYTQNQLLTKNAVSTRFGVYNDMLIASMLNEMGYTLDFTTDWTQKSNYYWSRTMVTSPILKELLSTDNKNFKYVGLNYNITKTGAISKYLFIPTDMGSSANDYFNAPTTTTISLYGASFSVPVVRIKMDSEVYRINYNLRFYNTQSDFIYITDPDSTSSYISSINTNKMLISAIINGVETEIVDLRFQTTIITNPVNMYTARFNFTNGKGIIQVYYDGGWKNLSTLIDRFNVSMNFDITTGTNNYSTVFIGYNDTQIRRGDLSTWYLDNSHINLNYTRTQVEITLDNTIQNNTIPKYINYLPDLTLKEYFIGYIKLFGLIPIVDETTKVVKLLTKKEYFNGTILDWSEKFANNLESTNVPLSFNKKYIHLSYKENDKDYYLTSYKNYNSSTYGSLKLNTGYNFDNDSYELFDGIPFVNTFYTNQLKTVFDGNTTILRPILFDEKLFESKTNNSPRLIFNSQYINTNNNYSNINGWYLMIEDTSTNTKEFGWRHNLSTFRKFKLDNLYYRYDGHIGLPTTFESSSLKVTNNLDTAGGSPTWTLDIAQPQYLAYDNLTYPTNGTIYKRLWEKYLLDRYNVNTRIFTGYFYLSKAELATLELNSFIWFKDRYWVINKIEYSVTEDKLSKVELISVNNMTNYTNGINLTNTI